MLSHVFKLFVHMGDKAPTRKAANGARHRVPGTYYEGYEKRLIMATSRELKRGVCELNGGVGDNTLLLAVEDVGMAVQWALAFLGCMKSLAKSPCVVFDIDGTVLLNQEGGATKCVVPFRRLLEACNANGIQVFYVTARTDTPSNRRYTVRQLEKCGVENMADLYMRPANSSYTLYKYAARRHIEKDGHTILLAVGDQMPDVNFCDLPLDDSKTYVGQIGDNKGFGIKLPSEFL